MTSDRCHPAPLRRAALIGLLAAGMLAVPRPPAARGAPPSPALPDLMNREIVDAVDRGLAYLAQMQRPDGRWLNQGGWGTYPTVMTSLAGLAMIAGGSTPETGPYARNVRKGMLYILNVAESRNDGLICDVAEGRSMYGHGFSMLFLASCYGNDLTTEYEQRLRTVLERAVQLTADAQSPLGGWTYTPGDGDEGSVTVTQLQALRMARNAGIKVPKEVIDKAVEYLRGCQNADGGISYSASSRGSSRPAISAAAIACFYAAGVHDRRTGGRGSEAEMVERLVAYVKANVSVAQGSAYGGYYFYTHLYMAESMYMRGGADWRDYYPAIAQRLLSLQAPDGSWNGDGIGTTYGTAIACMVLQLPYGYLPFCQR